MPESDGAGSAPVLSSCESPPLAPMPAREAAPDPRVRLLQLAGELTRSHNRRLVIEYLRLRRAIA
jgi:hypothetical protein